MLQERWDDLNTLKAMIPSMQDLRSLKVHTEHLYDGDPPVQDENGQPITFGLYLQRLNDLLAACRQPFLEQCPLLDESRLQFTFEQPRSPEFE